MKKSRIAAFILAVLALACALGALGVSADSSEYFTVVNDTVKPLEASNMPFIRDGEYYMPYTVFADSSLGVYYSYNEERYTLTLYNKNYTITFDSPAQVAYDRDQQYKIKLAANSAGTICVPMTFVCEKFGLGFETIRTHPIETMRVTSRSTTSGEDFWLANREKMVAMYLEYFAPSSEPSTSPSTVPSAQPSSSPSSQPRPSGAPSAEPSEEPRVVYITFDDGPNKNTAKILDTLAEHDMKATFFLTGSQIENNRDTVRRMAGEGHSIGLHAWSHKTDEMYASADALIEEIEKANEALDAVVQKRSRLFRFPYGSSYSAITNGMRDAVIGAGYRYWDWTVDALDYEQPSGQALAQQVIRGLERSDSTAVILMHDTSTTADALPRILDYIERNNFIVRTITIGEMPHNFYGDVRTSPIED